MKIAPCPCLLRVENVLTEAVAKGEPRLRKPPENWEAAKQHNHRWEFTG